MNKLIISVLLIVGTLAVVPGLIGPSDALAFDGQRKGFILGGGVGIGYAEVSCTAPDIDQRSLCTFGAQTAFIIGGGFSDQVSLSYTGLQFWGSGKSEEVGFALLPSLKVRYYLSPQAPSIFGTAGFGVAVFDAKKGDLNFGGGLAPHLGIGREWTRHITTELTVLCAGQIFETNERLWNVMLMLNALAY